jgi:hypothetical protein
VAEERASGGKRTVVSSSGSVGGRSLALVPLLVALLGGALMIPRSAEPTAAAIPVPFTNRHALAAIAARDRALADAARHEPLPGDVRALGSTVRDFNALQAKDSDAVSLGNARAALDRAIAPALLAGVEHVVALRAVQAEVFLEEVRRFEATGQESEELAAVGGPFARRMRLAGWCDEKNRVVLDEDQRRAAFKAAWTALTSLDRVPELAPTVDETRALYTLYIEHPHAPEAVREELASARKHAADASACRALDARERLVTEEWRLEKLKKLGAHDPAYPMWFAVGVAQYRRGQFPAAAEAFRTWTREHPTGPYALVARNYLKASIEAAAF